MREFTSASSMAPLGCAAHIADEKWFVVE